MKNDKLMKVGIFSAIFAGIACLVPPVLLLILGGSALAFLPRWLDFIFVPVFLVSIGLVFYLWNKKKKTVRATEQSD